MESRNPIVPPVFALILGIFAVSTASIFIRRAQEFAPSLVIASYRLSIATIILAPFTLKRHWPEISRLSYREIILALLSGFFLALHFATWIISLEYTTVASSVVFVSTVPLWVALIAPLTIKESITRSVLFGLLMALLGGVVVGLSDACIWEGNHFACPQAVNFVSGRAFLGDFLALIGAITAAGYLIIGRSLRTKVSLNSYIFLVYGMAAGVLIIIMLGSGYSPFGYPPISYLWFVLLAVIPQLIGHSIYNWALEYLTAAYVSIALLGEPIGSSILAYFFLDEIPSPLKVLGAILILIGIILASRRKSK